MYFNTKYERTGSLFEGKFKAEHLDSDRYLKYIFAYIHLNPIAKKARSGSDFQAAVAYAYSSLQLYAGMETSRPR